MSAALLVISFGTSYEESRKRSIDVLEEDLVRAFPQRSFYRAWTSTRMIRKVKETTGICYDNVREAIERMLRDGRTDVLVQPTYTMAGAEFEAAKDVLLSYRDRFCSLKIGEPLLSGAEDAKDLTNAIEEAFLDIKTWELLALMAHGSTHTNFPVSGILNERFRQDGFGHFCVGTVESDPGMEPVLQMIRERKPDRVYLTPLLVAAGGHAVKDMAGDHPGSWKSQLEKEGVKVVCIVKGMAEYEKIRGLYVKHAQNAKQI